MSEGKDVKTGKFLPGNRFWEARSTHGRKPIFDDPEKLRDACLQYFEWVEENPLYEQKAFHTNGIVTTHDLPRMRAMTIGGLCLFLDIALNTWENYKEKSDFLNVTREIEAAIRTQKFEGASADMLNANIIARDLGLADKKEHTGRVEISQLLDEVEDEDEPLCKTNG